MANTYLSRTSGTPTNALKWTFSTWIKLGEVINGDRWLLDFNTDSNNRSQIGFAHDYSKPQLIVYEKVSGSTSQLFFTAQAFRDPSAWMHILVSCDRTLGTDTERTKIYINGERVTAFHSTPTYPAQNTNGIINTAVSTLIGKYSQSTLYYNGLMTHTHFIDGTAYDASTFGESDSVSSIWVPKTAPSVTYGTNGFFLKFENSGAMGTDSSGNSNTFTVSGNLTQNVDTPSNNFTTMNPLDNYWMNGTFAYGNTRVTTDTTKFGYNTGTLGASSGKFYWEMKLAQAVTSGDYHVVGVASVHPFNQEGLGYEAGGYAYQGEQGNKRINGSQTSYGSAWSTNDIIGIAMDLDNKKLYFSKNNVWQNSGVPTSGSTGTGAISLTQDGFYYPAVSDHAGGLYSAGIFDFNFGNGYFGTTAVASAGTAPSEGGIFEYDCPSGYQALCTKGINSF